ncbi:MAG: DUF896 domain-containing protein [Clostridiales bacterium]|nr:DUF896 domain-containing protein [Clostridiales bacterium]
MNIDEVIKRINELAKKNKSPEGLTEDELKEREELRNIYRASVLGNLKSQMDNIRIQEVDGSVHKLPHRDQ